MTNSVMIQIEIYSEYSLVHQNWKNQLFHLFYNFSLLKVCITAIFKGLVSVKSRRTGCFKQAELNHELFQIFY